MAKNKTSKIKSSAKASKKRTNLTEHQILMEMQSQERISHTKDLVRKMFPAIEGVDTIYDAQTVVHALCGFIMPHMSKIKMSDLPIDLSKEDDTKVKKALEELLVILKDEPAKQLMVTLDQFGSSFAKFGADRFLKQPMSAITVDDIVSK
jgi:hypothetical protein